MNFEELKQHITISPRNKLITIISVVIIIAVIIEILPFKYVLLIFLLFLALSILLFKKEIAIKLNRIGFYKTKIGKIIRFDKQNEFSSSKRKSSSFPTREELEEVFGGKHFKKIKTIHEEIRKQREPVKEILDKTGTIRRRINKSEWVTTDIQGFDNLFEKGIPRGISALVAGGPGSGKTIFCLQVAGNAAKRNENALYISLEESEERLKKHMHDFGFEPEQSEKRGLLRIKRIDPFQISRKVEALLAEAKGELKIDIAEIGGLLQEDFQPDWIIIDSLTALEAAFKGGEDNYRIYVEQLFKYLEKLGATSFLIAETEQMPTRYSRSGVEEFLADSVIVLYNISKGNIRERAIEVLKLRGGKHEEKIVAMNIESEKGIVVYNEQEIFGDIKSG